MKVSIYDWERASKKIKRWKSINGILLGAWMMNIWYAGITLSDPVNASIFIFILCWHYFIGKTYVPKKEVEMPQYAFNALTSRLKLLFPGLYQADE